MAIPAAEDMERLEVLDLLRRGTLEPVGTLVDSSNRALLVDVVHGSAHQLAIHKPIAFERPLWDFPHGHLAWREMAAYEIAVSVGLAAIPPTIVREGPWGPGSLQQWVGQPERTDLEPLVVLGPRSQVPPGWLEVLSGTDPTGRDVVLAHSSDPQVADLALLDIILNNTDRKGNHVVRARDHVWGFDHGVTLGAEPKLRTVLWGWAGQRLPDRHLDLLDALGTSLGSSRSAVMDHLRELLTTAEIDALRDRVRSLRQQGTFPLPSGRWPAIPWPAL